MKDDLVEVLARALCVASEAAVFGGTKIDPDATFTCGPAALVGQPYWQRFVPMARAVLATIEAVGYRVVCSALHPR